MLAISLLTVAIKLLTDDTDNIFSLIKPANVDVSSTSDDSRNKSMSQRPIQIDGMTQYGVHCTL